MKYLFVLTFFYFLVSLPLSAQESPKVVFQTSHADYISELAFSPSSRYLSSTSENDIKIWDLQKRLLASSFSIEGENITNIAFENDSLLVVLTTDGKLYKYDTRNNNIIWHAYLEGSRYRGSYFMTLDNTNNTIIVQGEAYEGCFIKEVSLDNGVINNTIIEDLERIWGFAQHKNNIYYIDDNHLVYAYNTLNKENRVLFESKKTKEFPVKIRYRNKHIVILFSDAYFYYYDEKGKFIKKDKGTQGNHFLFDDVSKQSFYGTNFYFRNDHPMLINDKAFLVPTKGKEDFRGYDIQGSNRIIGENLIGEKVNIQISEKYGMCNAISLDESGKVAAAAYGKKIIILSLTKKVEEIKFFERELKTNADIEKVNDEKLLIYGYGDNSVEEWNLPTGKATIIKSIDFKPKDIDYSENAKILAVSKGLEVMFYDLEYRLQKKLVINSNYVNKSDFSSANIQPGSGYPVKFSENGDFIATVNGSIDSVGVKVWTYPELRLVKNVYLGERERDDTASIFISHLDFCSSNNAITFNIQNQMGGGDETFVIDLGNNLYIDLNKKRSGKQILYHKKHHSLKHQSYFLSP